MKRPLSPDERFQYAEHAGQGLYSALQLYHMMKSKPVSVDESNILKIKVPKEKLQKEAGLGEMVMSLVSKLKKPATSAAVKPVSDYWKNNPYKPGGLPPFAAHTKVSNDRFLIDAANDQGHKSFPQNLKNVLGPHIAPIALSGMGFMNGFNNEKSTYDELERSHLQKQLDHEEKQYLHLLSRIKTSAETPLVDAFVRGVLKTATSSEKEVADKIAVDDAADGSLRQLFHDTVFSQVKKPFAHVVNTAKKLHEGMLLSSAITAFMLKQKLFDKPQSQHTPSRVEIVPV